MFWSPRSFPGRVVGVLYLTAFLGQLGVFPLLHARHAAVGERALFLTSGIDDEVRGAGGLSAAADAHDARSCPICAVLAKGRVGIVPIGTTWQVPPLAVVHFSATPSVYRDAARSHPAEPRAPPAFSL